MTRHGFARLVVATALMSPALPACRHGGLPLFNLLGLDKPIVIALVSEGPLAILNPFSPYEGLRTAMSDALGRPVAVDLCLMLQAEPCLRDGRYHLAFVAPTQYAEIKDREQIKAIAVSADAAGRMARSAVLISLATSSVATVGDLRGKSVAFGPDGDSRTHRAALALLRENGLQPADLALELLPIPGSLKHAADARGVTESVINGSSAAGFIDEAAWEALPPHDDRTAEPAKDRFRVIAKTVALPDRIVLMSPQLDAKSAEQIRQFVLNADAKSPAALKPLNVAAYRAPTKAVLDACESLVPR